MKPTKSILAVLCFVFAIAFTSCSTKLNFLTSSVVPAAQGAVKISKDENKNYEINIKIENLADPSRLQPKKDLYVVWLVTSDKVTKNIGRLNSSKGFFSGALEGKLTTVSPVKPDHVFITAENSADVQYPVGTVVLTTKGH